MIDELDDFGRIWKSISQNLAASQIKNVIGLIETKPKGFLSRSGRVGVSKGGDQRWDQILMRISMNA